MKNSLTLSCLLELALTLTFTISILALYHDANAGALDAKDVEESGGDEDREIGENEPYNSDSSETTNSSIDPATLEAIRQAILYGSNSEGVEDKSPTVTPETPAEYSTGRIHVKMKPGTRLEKADGVSSLYDSAGKSTDTEALYYLDYEFPDLQIKPLYGDAERLAKLKARGEDKSGRTLPDLSLWVEITPMPEHVGKEMIDGSEAGMPLLEKESAQCIERTLEILKTMPDVEMVHAIPPFVQSSWPSFFHNWPVSSDWSNHQLQTAPDIYYEDGDYDYSLKTYDLQTIDYPYSAYNWVNYPHLICGIDEDGQDGCKIGGLNIWPAWDKAYKGEDIPIGYIEVDWCLDQKVDGDYDYDYSVDCPTHPDLNNFHDNQLEHVTFDRRSVGVFNYVHGTAVLGIMAADHNTGTQAGGMGISPDSRYYIGQVLNTGEWIDIAERLVADNNGKGAVFLLEATLNCYNTVGIIPACPVEVFPEFHDYIQTITANDIVVLNIPGNGIEINNSGGTWTAGVNLDAPQYFTSDGDYELSELDLDLNEGGYEFDYPDGDIVWSEGVEYPTQMIALRRSSSSYSDPGTILVTAGTSQDTSNSNPRRSRTFWSTYGSRADIQARGDYNLAPSYYDLFSSYTYTYFSGTSSCGPQATGVAALVQQMYKDVRSDHLTSIRMRNALVENGNPQITLSVDPNRTLNNFGEQQLPYELETPAEPFARIGPRPDAGNVIYAFGLDDCTASSCSHPYVRYRFSFNDHQYWEGTGLRLVSGGSYSYYKSYRIPLYKPNEPYAMNYAMQPNSAWERNIRHVRSPRIAGGHAVKIIRPEAGVDNGFSSGRLLQVMDDSSNAETYLQPDRGAGGHNDFTISAWIVLHPAAEGNSDYHYIFYKERLNPWKREYGFAVNPSNKLYFGFHNQACTSHYSANGEVILENNRLYYVAVVVRQDGYNTKFSFYVDGQLDKTITKTGVSGVCSLPEYLPFMGWRFNGILDEVLFEDVALEIDANNEDACPELQARYEAGRNPPGLVSEWRFDKKNATTIYDSVSGYDGVLNSATNFYNAWGPGRPIGNFTGSQYIQIPDSDNLPCSASGMEKGFSVEAHFKYDGYGTDGIVSRGAYSGSNASWKLTTAITESRRTLTFTVFRNSTTYSSVTSASFLTLGRWYHVVATYDRQHGKMTLYIDGKFNNETNSGVPSTCNAASAYDVQVGSVNGDYKRESQLDYVRIYKQPLDDENGDIAFLFKNRSAIWQNSYYGDYTSNRYSDE